MGRKGPRKSLSHYPIILSDFGARKDELTWTGGGREVYPIILSVLRRGA